MITIDTLKLNKFQEVSIPSPSDLYARFGMTNRQGSYTGEQKAPMNQTKIEQMAEVQAVAVEKED